MKKMSKDEVIDVLKISPNLARASVNAGMTRYSLVNLLSIYRINPDDYLTHEETRGKDKGNDVDEDTWKLIGYHYEKGLDLKELMRRYTSLTGKYMRSEASLRTRLNQLGYKRRSEVKGDSAIRVSVDLDHFKEIMEECKIESKLEMMFGLALFMYKDFSTKADEESDYEYELEEVEAYCLARCPNTNNITLYQYSFLRNYLSAYHDDISATLNFINENLRDPDMCTNFGHFIRFMDKHAFSFKSYKGKLEADLMLNEDED